MGVGRQPEGRGCGSISGAQHEELREGRIECSGDGRWYSERLNQISINGWPEDKDVHSIPREQ
jgi:hypothetical protein